jgi:DNA polymerase elongation subunit (family B)
MTSCTGWILDVYIEEDQAILWIKTEEDNTLKLMDCYEPYFYIEPKSEKDGMELFQVLRDMELIKELRWEYKFTDINNNVSQKLLCIGTYLIHHYNLLLKVLQHDILRQRIRHLYNTPLSHLQRYLFTRLKIQVTSKVSVEYQDRKLRSITRMNDEENIELPFSIMQVEIIPTTEQSTLDADDPIQSIDARYNEEGVTFHDDESTLLQDFFNYIVSKDPDIIIFKNNNQWVLNYLLERVKSLSLDLKLGRWKTDIYDVDQKQVLQKWIQGRLYTTQTDYTANGLAGLYELAQFSYLPISLILKYSIGRLIANRNIYEMLIRGFVIPDNNNNQRTYERVRTLEDIVDKDKAGMIFSPKVGLHENVAVLDYNDEFANIIVNENISYEIVGENKQPDSNPVGILPQIVKQLVSKRIHLKQLLKQLPSESREASHCEQQADTIKKILVCLYGTTGSYWNKYGNVSAFEAINKKSREILLKTKDIVQELSYELIYADTDAAFVHKDNATEQDYEELREIISKKTGMSLSLEYRYKFLVLLPLEADEKLEALKHYFGITYSKEMVTRGIEIRRDDTPNFIKQFQTELLHTLFDCDNAAEIYDKTLEKALLCITKTIDKIMTGEIYLQDLVISKQLRMNINHYKSIFPHVAAAIQLGNNERVSKGDDIEYVYTDSQHQNPLSRVVPVQFIRNNRCLEYDKEKYKEILLDASETVLGIFGFDRTLFGKPKDKRWWMQLRRNRMSDVKAEFSS